MNCKVTYHVKCVHLDRYDIEFVNFMYCPYSLGDTLVYNHLDDDNEFYSVIMGGMLACLFNFHETSKEVFLPFEIKKEIDTPLTEMDPDVQFYLESSYFENTKSNYYIADRIIKILSRLRKIRGHF